MKICWDNIEKISKITRNGNFKIGTAIYTEEESCKECHEPYLNKLAQQSEFCSISCTQKNRNSNYNHGQVCRRKGTSTYNSWSNMKYRCLNPKATGYKNYGGRGITICERWLEKNGFINLLADMGERPEGKTLDRIDNDGNYEPSNCKWSTYKEQFENSRIKNINGRFCV